MFAQSLTAQCHVRFWGDNRQVLCSCQATKKIRAHQPLGFLRPLKLSRKVFRLPGSIWREDKAAVLYSQRDSSSIPVKICRQVCKIRWLA